MSELHSTSLIDSSRHTWFQTRVGSVIANASAAKLEDLVNALQIEEPAHLHRAVSEAMTVNETSFFRDRRMFDVLRSTIVPRLIAANSSRQTLRIWSAAGATGQEAYSLAMLLCEHFARLTDWDVKIIGTDISRCLIEYARRARYSRLEVKRGLPEYMLRKYTVHHGEQWEIAPGVRSMCDFRCANLCSPLPDLPMFDLVLLRNILLYIPQESRSAVFRSVHHRIVPGGYLVLGASEQAEESTNIFQPEFAHEYCFYRPAAPTQP